MNSTLRPFDPQSPREIIIKKIQSNKPLSFLIGLLMVVGLVAAKGCDGTIPNAQYHFQSK